MYSAILTEMGAVVQDGEVHVRSFSFSRRAQEYLEVKAGKARMDGLVAFLESAGPEVETNDAGLLAILKRGSLDARMMDDDRIEAIQDAKPALLVAAGFASNEHDALGKLREFALDLSSSRVAQVSEAPDLHIIQAINSLDETDRMANALFGRVREWYGLHFPELENLVDGMLGYCRVALTGRRDDLDTAIFEEVGFPKSKADMLNLVARTSRGGQVSEENLQRIQAMARQVVDLNEARRALEDHVESEMRLVAPNLSAILGTGVGARLLAKAGSLSRLSTMAASTIQVLGAEKALFRSIKTGSQPPKHGLIFQHAMVHRAPRWQRGKIARAVASKAVIAARMDVHEPVLNETLLEKLNVRVDEIGQKYSDPPQRTAPPPVQKPRRAGKPRREERSRRPSGARKGAKRKRRFAKR